MPILILALAVLAAHGRGILDGLFLDDHLHVPRYRMDDWSIRHLLDATTIVPGEFMETWWQERPIQWQYARPFSVLLAKAVYHLSGESVKALHGLSLALHFAAAVMVYRLCMLLTRRAGWSLIGGLLFVIHSHSVYAVGWLAAQNCVLQTVLTLATLLCYIRASGLNVYAGNLFSVEPKTPAPLARGWLLASLLCWGLALFSRENALVFPAFAAAFDLAFSGRRQCRRRLPVYVFMGVSAIVFVFWRLGLYYHPMPAFYVRSYDGPGYPLWWLAKLLHYITGVVWLSPLMIGPSSRFNPFQEVPGDCLLMIGIIGVMAVGYYLACRRARGWWLWPAWILLSLLPVVPVFAGPHSAYMPAVGFAVAMILGPALRREIRPTGIGRWCSGVAVWFLIATATYMPIYHTFWTAVQSAERLTVAQMAADPPSPETTDVFLINVPFVNIYARLHLEEELARQGVIAGPDDFRCHVLTYAPNVLRMDEECRLEQIDAYSFRLAIQGRGYFSSALGRFLVESMRPSGRLHQGQAVAGAHFDVEILRADADGVHELQFRFPEPLASPRYCFYLSTNQQAAIRVQFWRAEGPITDMTLVRQAVTPADIETANRRLQAGESQMARVFWAGMRSEDDQVRAKAVADFRQVAIPVARALAAPVQARLMAGDWTESDVDAIRQWWTQAVNDRILQVIWTRRQEWESLQRQRDRLFAIQWIASRIIQTDLYMTGPPFPGPR